VIRSLYTTRKTAAPSGPMMIAERCNMVDLLPPGSIGSDVRHFEAGPGPALGRPQDELLGTPHFAVIDTGSEETVFMQRTEPESAAFDIAQAQRVLREAFAPWVLDLGLMVERVDCDPPAAAEDWQPGAVLRMGFSERLCRHGGVICGQALMALADTAMVIAMVAANRGYRPMTTVDQTTHFMRAAASSDVLADARVVRLGRTMSFGRVTLVSATDNRQVAMVSSAFAML
jgi:uncharacterized protein (TIGR00369 family)